MKPSLENYKPLGFIYPIEVLTELELIEINNKIDFYIRDNNNDINCLKRGKLNESIDFINEISRKSNILDIVELTLGPNILCWAAGVFIKPALSKTYTSWHQDYFYWGLEPNDVVTIWIALTPATRENGCMQFICDKSYFRKMSHNESFDEHSMLSHGQQIEEIPETVNKCYVELNSGQASLHHVLTPHQSSANNSHVERRALVIRYIAAHVKQTIHKDDTAVLVRGEKQDTNIRIVE